MKLPIVLLLSAAVLLVLPLGGASSLDRAEVYFLDGARSMIERGDYLVPYYRDEPFFDKPPLTYWLIAAAFHLFGYSPQAARLVPALAALGTLLATYWLGRTLLGHGAGWLGAWVLLTTVPFLSFARIAMADMLLTLWSTCALALAAAALARPRERWLVVLAGVALGLGFLSKGPVALLLPGLAIGVLVCLRWREARALSLGAAAVAALLMLVLGGAWFVAVYLRLGAEPLRYFFLRENLQRFATGAYDKGHGPWYFCATYLLNALPWSLFAPLALVRLIRGQGGRPVGLLWLWGAVAAMLVPLSLSRGKLDYYLLPAYPLLALLVGHTFTSPAAVNSGRTWSRLALGVAILALLVSAIVPARLPDEWLPPVGALLASYLGLAAALVGLVRATLRPAHLRVLGALAAAVALVFLAFTYVWLPAFGAAQPNRAIVADVVREHSFRPDVRLALCADPTRVQRDLIFATEVTTFESCELWAPASSPYPFLLLLREDEWPSLKASRGIRFVGEYRYIPASALSLHSFLKPPQARHLFLAANYQTDDPVARERRRTDRHWRELRKRLRQKNRARNLEPGSI